ncbi:hypothetical protein [Methylobacterium komagatae]
MSDSPLPTRAEEAREAGQTYGIIDPDYARVFTVARCIAWSEGYAMVMHGSFTRDLDLLAVPWADEATDAEHLIRRISLALDDLDLLVKDPKASSQATQKPHGRLAWTLTFKAFGDPRFIDISVMPRAARAEAEVARLTAAVEKAERERDALRFAIQAATDARVSAENCQRHEAERLRQNPYVRGASAVASISKLTERVAVLEGALKPFAKLGALFGPRASENCDVLIYGPAAGPEYNLTGDHLRAAVRALSTHPKHGGEDG